MPWLIAGFLAMIFLVPFEAIHLKVKLPVSSDLDRFFIVLIVATWAVVSLVGKDDGIRRLRPRGWAAAMIAFVFVGVASVAVNVDRITNLGEWDVAQKKLAVLLGLVAIFAFVALTMRVAELRPFAVLIVVLATLTAVGTIYEQKAGYNLFYETASAVFSPIATVDPAPTDISHNPKVPGRPMIAGPTRHPLSVASLLGMALPFAVVLAAVAPTLRRRLLFGVAACLIIAGALVTQRKSGVVVPAFALLTLFVLRPRQFLHLAPFGIVAIVFGLALSGGASAPSRPSAAPSRPTRRWGAPGTTRRSSLTCSATRCSAAATGPMTRSVPTRTGSSTTSTSARSTRAGRSGCWHSWP